MLPKFILGQISQFLLLFEGGLLHLGDLGVRVGVGGVERGGEEVDERVDVDCS